jgi:hypothetical protein
MDEGRDLTVEDSQLLRLYELRVLELGGEIYAVKSCLVGFTRIESVDFILNSNDLQGHVWFNIDLSLVYVHPSFLHIPHYFDLVTLIPRHTRRSLALNLNLSLIQPKYLCCHMLHMIAREYIFKVFEKSCI